MAVRAIQARIECDKTLVEHLWRTHRVFNERLPRIISILFKMRRGECGTTDEERTLYKTIARFVLARNAKDAPYLLHSISIKDWTPTTAKKMKATIATADGSEHEVSGDTWADRAAELSAAGKLLYSKNEVLGDLPDSLRQIIIRECVAIISGHDELVRNWEKAHAEWLKKREDWEEKEEHKKYLAVRSRFEDFEKSVGGKAGKRRARWHKYLQWLRENPELAGWRGGAAVVNELSKEAQERVRKAKPWRQRSVEAEEFWRENPELQALDKLHGDYEKEFVRRRKTKRNPDGFEHRPTFTLPDFLRHPRWLVFNAPQTSPPGYRNLTLPTKAGQYGGIELRLLTGEIRGRKYPEDWVKIRFLSDPRLADFRPVKIQKAATKGRVKGELRERLAYRFFDRELQMERPAQISGAKLIFKNVRFDDGSLQSATPYLYFTCEAESLRWTENARKVKWTETGEVTRRGKKRGYRTLPDGLMACAVDLGVRNLGFATLARYDNGVPRVLRSRNLWMGHVEAGGRHPGRWSEGPELAHLARHKRELRRLRSLRGDPVAGEDSHIELQQHITHFAEDRFKKAARAIVNFALNAGERADKRTGEVYPRADVLVLENLATLLPDAEREKGINRSLIEFNRGHLVDRVKELAKDVGLRVFEVSPVGTSQVCSRCGTLGRRYSIRSSPETHRLEVQFGFVEKLFACPECGYRANADHNASVNLHRKLARVPGAFERWEELRGLSKEEKRLRWEEIEAKLLPSLQKMHGLDVVTEPRPSLSA
jgi:hypothetical protein